MPNCVPRVTTDSTIHTIPTGPWTVPVLSKVKETIFAFNSALPLFLMTLLFLIRLIMGGRTQEIR